MVSNDVRTLLEQLARSRRTRRSTFDPRRPTHWAPYEVRIPGSGDTFTADSCWEFVADLIGGGAEIEMIELDIPRGKTGYVMKLDGYGGDEIYIKLQLAGEFVIGRSFHASIKKDIGR